MRFWLTLFGMVVLAGLLGPFLPWWSLAVVTFVAGGLSGLRPAAALGAGFLAGGLLWAGYAFWLNYYNEGVLSARMGALFGGLEGWSLLLLTGLLGALLGGLGAWTGGLGRRALS